MEISVLENHKNCCRALRTIFPGWYAWIELKSKKVLRGIVTVSMGKIIKVNGEFVSKKDPIVYYKPVKFN